MTYVLIIAIVALTVLCGLLLYTTYYWHNRYINTGISVELELATQKQIVDELRSRPNTAFLMLEPVEETEGDIVVTTHAWNLPPEVILASLKAAYDGMIEHLDVEVQEDKEE
jgi:hypothetical protein